MSNKILTIGAACCLVLSTGSGTFAEPRAAATGSVSVRSEPADAAVYLEGQLAGRTPVTFHRVPSGDHRVRVVKDGYLESQRIVAVSAGRTTSVELQLTASAAANGRAEDQTGGGISSGPPPGAKKKWLYLGAAGAGATATALVLATRNRAPVLGSLSASPPTGLQAATPIAFSASGASDPDGDTLTYTWEFGDGSTANEPAPRHVYNSAGTFSVKCTISDGKHSASVSTATPVTVRSLEGTWRGVLDDVQVMFGITHSGAALGGTVVDAFASGSLSGFVATSPPLVRFTILQTGFFPYTYTADPNADITTLTGVLNGSGYANKAFAITRQ
jgi:hypothetical protein